jgi:hypothetical protein
MDARQQLTITTNNAFQNLGTAEFPRANAVGNLSIERPTVEQMNAAIGVSESTASRAPDAFFGTHVREAVAIVKDWVKPR